MNEFLQATLPADAQQATLVGRVWVEGQGPVLVVQATLAASIQLGFHIVTNSHLNGEVSRPDGALRMAPR